MSVATSFKYGVETCSKFLRLNGIPIPSIQRTGMIGIRRALGVYHPLTNAIAIDLTRCDEENHVGYWQENTSAGVIAHEIGHYVHYYRGQPRGTFSESRISIYDRNWKEIVAEAMRIFILNPALLEKGRPQRYDFCYHVLDLRPLDIPLDIPTSKVKECAAWINSA